MLRTLHYTYNQIQINNQIFYKKKIEINHIHMLSSQVNVNVSTYNAILLWLPIKFLCEGVVCLVRELNQVRQKCT